MKTIGKIALPLLCLSALSSFAQQQPFSISGQIGITYEHYGLNINPVGGTFFLPRQPWNQVRFLLQPNLQFSKDFSIPFNFNFTTSPANYAGPYAGLQNQTFGQWITNPSNNFGVNPKYKWAELQLGTQYLHYSDLSTGDIGVFGAGIDLRPKIFRVKFFAGNSQSQVNYVPGPIPPGVQGAYKRMHWMTQVGIEKENNYRVLFNLARGEDRYGTLPSPPPTIKPQEGAVISLILDKYFEKGWYVKTETAESVFTRDLYQMPAFENVSLKPVILGRASTQKDYAAEASVGKKSTDLDLSFTSKYIGAGFQTMGYPYLSPDHWDNTINTRFNAWKHKINVTGSAGIRINNMSSTSLQSQQFIGNLNWYTQFNEHFGLNINYNNFGFTAASGTNPYGIKNVSNDFGVSPTITWSNTKMLNVITMSYNYSKYDERDVMTGLVTSNNTHTAMLSYIPTFLQKEISPEFSVLYFNNQMDTLKNRLLTFSAALSMPAIHKKMQLKAQVQYTLGKVNSFTGNQNLIPSINIDYKLTKKLTWTTFASTNYFKYGNELTPPLSLDGANYLETIIRTGLKYKF